MRITAFIMAAMFCVLCLSGSFAADRNVGTIQLSANPMAIVADGKSICVVTAQVKDKNGAFVNDQEIQFTTSLGVIEQVGRTSTGAARVKLISSDVKGTAVVTATWVEGQAVAQTNVVFGDATVVSKGPEYVSVSADKYLAYSVDHKVLEGIGKVKVKYRHLQLEAGEVQIDCETHRIVAKGDIQNGPIKIKTKEGFVTGNLFYAGADNRGVLISVDTGHAVELDLAHGIPSVTGKPVNYSMLDFDFVELDDSMTIIKCKTATVFYNQKIQFTKANLYVAGKHRFSLPLYVLSMNGYEVDGQPYFDYSTSGISLNLPYYYSLSPSSTGAFIVRNGGSTGWGTYGQTPGWGLDMREKYSTEYSQGSLELTQVTSSDWGAHFQHSQQIDQSTQSYLYLDYPAHRDLYGRMNVSRSFSKFDMGLDLSGSKYALGSTSFGESVYAQTKPKNIGKSIFKYTVSSRLSDSQSISPEIITINEDGTETSSSAKTNVFTKSVDTSIFSSPYHIAKKVSLTSSVGVGYLWGDPVSGSGTSTTGLMMADWKISPRTNFSVSYRYANRTGYTQLGKQSLTSSWRYSGKRWQTSLYAVKGLDYTSLNMFADASYKVDRLWRIGVRTTLNQFLATIATTPVSYKTQSYNDFEVQLGRMIGNRELIAVWSKSQHRVMFQLGSGVF